MLPSKTKSDPIQNANAYIKKVNDCEKANLIGANFKRDVFLMQCIKYIVVLPKTLENPKHKKETQTFNERLPFVNFVLTSFIIYIFSLFKIKVVVMHVLPLRIACKFRPI